MELAVGLLLIFLWFCACLFVAGLASGWGWSPILFFLLAVVATPVCAVVILLLLRSFHDKRVPAPRARPRRVAVTDAPT
jgi:hypothetical protein